MPRLTLRTLLQALVACAVCSIVAPGLRAQGVALRGEVLDEASGVAVVAARVVVDARPAALADSVGRFVVLGLHAGDHRVRVERLGYAATEMVVSVTDSLYLTVTLKAEPQALEAVAATAAGTANVPERMRGFEYRRTHHQGSGRFITRADLEQSARSTLANVLRRLPGVRIIHGGGAMGDNLATGESVGPHALNRPPAPCYAQVFVNGVQIYAMGRGDPPNLNEIDVNDVEAIEYYGQPSSTPTQFRTMDSDCGTLVLWMRFAR